MRTCRIIELVLLYWITLDVQVHLFKVVTECVSAFCSGSCGVRWCCSGQRVKQCFIHHYTIM